MLEPVLSECPLLGYKPMSVVGAFLPLQNSLWRVSIDKERADGMAHA